MQFRILYQDPSLVAIDKPAGYHVHPPEDPSIRVSESRNSLALLKRQIGRYLYPVHRIDCSTSGVLMYALDQEMARQMSRLFEERAIRKTYYCVVRGWVDECGVIDRPLKSEAHQGPDLPSVTRFWRVAQVELPYAIGKYSTARYSLMRAEPITGRYHQIRRHLAGEGHPILCDSVHGDGVHNRFFRNQVGTPSLLLKAQALRFIHPQTGEQIQIESRWSGNWHRVFDLFGICPTRYNKACNLYSPSHEA